MNTKSNLQIEKRIHRAWKELQHSPLKDKIPSICGKYQYIYTTDKGQISLVELKDYFRDGKDLWEIYSLKGDLFEDVERFDSKEEAEIKIKEILH